MEMFWIFIISTIYLLIAMYVKMLLEDIFNKKFTKPVFVSASLIWPILLIVVCFAFLEGTWKHLRNKS